MKTLLGLALAAVIIIPAHASMRATAPVGGAPIVKVEGGCGPDEHRAPDGACRHDEHHGEMRREERRHEEIRHEERRREERHEEHRREERRREEHR